MSYAIPARELIASGVHVQGIRVIQKKEKKPRKKEEEILQVNCVQWFDLQYPRFQLCLIHPPNGGVRPSRVDPKTGARYSPEAMKLKRMGVRAGVLDLLLLVKRRGFGGLFIEMKAKNGEWSKEQLEFRAMMFEQGYYVEECRSLESFIKIIKDYLN